MIIYLIRHGKTLGNLEKRYIGKTDEPLCESGISELKKISYPRSELLVCSPMKRCVQTAEILFPGQKYITCGLLRECDFGDFEGKNYHDLNGNEYYQRWIDSGGELAFPGGELPSDFRKRCAEGVEGIVREYADMASITFVVHDGTIMSILDKFAAVHRDYFEWHTENGHGYICVLSTYTGQFFAIFSLPEACDDNRKSYIE